MTEAEVEAAARAIYEDKGLHLSTGRDWSKAIAADRHYCLSHARAALAAAEKVRKPPFDLDTDAAGYAAYRQGVEDAAKVVEGMQWYRATGPKHVRANGPADYAKTIRALTGEKG